MPSKSKRPPKYLYFSLKLASCVIRNLNRNLLCFEDKRGRRELGEEGHVPLALNQQNALENSVPCCMNKTFPSSMAFVNSSTRSVCL